MQANTHCCSRIFLFIVVLLCSVACFSQIRQPRFQRISVEEGLTENFATCIIQDRTGYIWFGTQEGLVRYDGFNVRIYRFKNRAGQELAQTSVQSLYEDRAGNLWVGTRRNGIFRYDHAKDDFIQYAHAEKESATKGEEHISGIREDENGNIWFSGSQNRKPHLDKLEVNTGTISSFNPSVEGRFLFFESDSTYRVWIGAENGLYVFDESRNNFVEASGGKLKNVSFVYEAPSQPGKIWVAQGGAPGAGFSVVDKKTQAVTTYIPSKLNADPRISDTVLCLFEDRAKRLWLGTENGLLLFDRNNLTIKPYFPAEYQNDKNSNSCIDIKEDGNGALWIITTVGVLYLESPSSKPQRFTQENDQPDVLKSNLILNSYVDRNGIVWLGSRRHGLYRLNEQRSRFQFISRLTSENYPGGSTTCIARISPGTYMIGTSDALYLTDSVFCSFRKVEIPGWKQEIQPTDILVDRQRNVWIATRNAGLFLYDHGKSGKFRQFISSEKDKNSLSDNAVLNLMEDSKGNLWIGTNSGGLCRMDLKTQQITRFPFIRNVTIKPQNGEVDDERIISLYEDKKGTIWVGSNQGSVNRYDEANNRFVSYYDRESPLKSITDITEDSKGRFWVGTYLSGVFLFDRETGKYNQITEKSGLVSNNVNTIQEDKRGRIWISSTRGYSIIEPGTMRIKQLTRKNGLPVSDFIFHNTAETENGDWLMCSQDGMVRFNPQSLHTNNTPPSVIIQSVNITRNDGANTKTFMRSLPDSSRLELRYNENRLTIQYAGIHYTNPASNTYRYRLLGYDEGWIDAGVMRTATYTNLAPGKYTFEVSAASADGVWSAKNATISIRIYPPWWQTWWAYLCFVLIALAVVAAYVSYRSRSLIEQNKLLEERVNLRTNELQQSIQDLKSTQAQLIHSEKMASLGQLTAGIAHEIQNPLNFINNFAEVSEELADEMNEELKKGNVAPAVSLLQDVKDNMRKIVYHGHRADSIVKNMLQHSRLKSGQMEPVDINTLVDEYMRLSYHGLRAKDKKFNATIKMDLSPAIDKVKVFQQDISMVLLNLFNNAFYSVYKKKLQTAGEYEPTVFARTIKDGKTVKIIVRDNGMGIPPAIIGKIFDPFFTTKPTGEGTGLGLSISYDVITKVHSGKLEVKSVENEFAEFTIILPQEQL